MTRFKRSLLVSLVAVGLLGGGVALATEDPADPHQDIYTSAPNNARHDEEHWNPNSLFDIEDNTTRTMCTVGLGWNWDGHSANEWVVTAGHCLPYDSQNRSDRGDSDISGVYWKTDANSTCIPSTSSTCYPAVRKEWGYWANAGADRSTLQYNYNADTTYQNNYGVNNVEPGDIAIFRVDKDSMATKGYYGFNVRADLGLKYSPANNSTSTDYCTFSPMRMDAMQCGYTAKEFNTACYDPDGPDQEICGLSILERQNTGTCATEDGDSGGLVFKMVTGQPNVMRPIGIISGEIHTGDTPFTDNCDINDVVTKDQVLYTSVDQIQFMFPGNHIKAP